MRGFWFRSSLKKRPAAFGLRPTKLLAAREKKPLVLRVLPGPSCSKGGKRYLRDETLVSG